MSAGGNTTTPRDDTQAPPTRTDHNTTINNDETRRTQDREPTIITRDQSALMPAWQEFMRQKGRSTDWVPMRHHSPPDCPTRTQSTLSQSNRVNNKHFGDSLLHKKDNIFRLFCINPQGIKPHNDFLDFREFCTEMRNNDVDGFCLSGTDTEFNDTSTSENFYNIVRSTWKNVRLATATSDIKFQTPYKPGGTCMAITGPWSGRARKTGKDQKGLGRWSFIEIITKMSGLLIICTVYQVVTGSITNRGPFTNWNQQWTLLRMSGVESPDPAQQFYTDLNVQIADWKRAGAEVLILGDFNEDQTSVTSPLYQLCQRHDLGDLIASRHGRSDIATYSRGRRKLDHGLGTRKLRERIHDHMRCGYLPFNEIVSSDHRGFWFDIDTDAILGAPTPELITLSQRTINSKNPKMVIAYVGSTRKYLDEHSYGQRMERTTQGTRAEGLTRYWKVKLESLDEDLRRARLSAEKKQKRFPGRYWTMQIRVASLTKRFWWTCLSSIKTGNNLSRQMESIAEKLDWAECPTTSDITVANSKLKEAAKILKTCWKDSKKDRRAMQDAGELDAELKGDRARKKAILQVRKKEARADTFRRLKTILKPERSQGLSQIEVEVQFDQRQLHSVLLEITLKLRRVTAEGASLQNIETLEELWRKLHTNTGYKLSKAGLEKLKKAGLFLLTARYNPRTAEETTCLGEALLGLQLLEQIGATKIICDPAEMYDKILERQPRHFGQATGTPFTIDPIKTILGFAGTSPASNDILRGTGPTCPPIHEFPETKLLWKNLAQFSEVPPISSTATEKEHIQGLRKWREGTSTSPSNVHLGHSKALVPKWMDKKEYRELRNEARRILNYQLSLVNFASHYGYSFKRWQKVVSAMIEKKQGNYQLEKLRTIHIMEADYNWILGLIFGRKMVYQAARLGMLHNNSYGSRPGKNATDATLVKELSYTISRLARHPMGSFDNDAKSCYDRVVMNLALLLARRLGVPASTCEMFALTLHMTEYYIKTLYGVSHGSYSWSEFAQVHGAGQGCRAAPALWLIVSCLLFVCLDELARGAHFGDPTGTLRYSQTCVAFVDDTNGMHTPAKIDASPTVIAAGLQHDAQTWERLLWSAGGALELTKCGFYILHWQFDAVGNPSMRSNAELGRVTVALSKGLDKGKVAITQWDVTEAHRTLGHWKNPAGVQDVQVAKLLEKSNEQAIAIEGSTVDREQAWTGFWTIWLPAVGFPLPVCFLSRPELELIQQRAINAWIPKMGISSKTSRAVVFGPKKYGGFGLFSLFTVQGVGQVTLLMKHLRADEEIARLIRIAYGWYQLNAGVSFNILQRPMHPTAMDYVHGGQFFNSVQYFLHHCNASLQFDTTRLPTKLRISDRILMDDFIEHGCPPKDLVLANNCRLYLQVECLSEICEESGLRIAPYAWDGNRDLANSRSTLEWPVQERPNEIAWSAFRRLLNALYLQSKALVVRRKKKDMKLATHLGRWFQNHSKDRRWQQYYSTTTHRLYRRTDWTADSTFDTHNRNLGWTVEFTASSNCRHIPPEAFPAQTKTTPEARGLVQHFGFFGIADAPTPMTSPATFLDSLESLETWERMLLRCVACTTNLLSLKHHIEQGDTIYIASDGGANAVAGSFGWVIATKDKVLWKGKGPVFGIDPASFRAEAYGMHAVIRFLYQYVKYFRIIAPKKRHKHYCDNQSILTRVTNNMGRGFVKASVCIASDYDIEASIVTTLRELGPMTFSHEWVEAHQEIDENSPWDAKLNDACDILATEYLQEAPHSKPHVPWNPASNCMLYVEGQVVNRRLKESLREAATKWELLEHIDDINRSNWNFESRSSMVDWEAHGKATTALPRTQWMLITKFKNNILSVNTRMAVRHAGTPPHCASCHTEDETDNHLYTCLARPIWKKKTLEGLERLLDDLETHPDLSYLLLFGMRALVDPLWQPPMQARREQLDHLIDAQDALGWQNLWRGLFSRHWSEIQERHYRRIHPSDFTKKGPTWTKRVITYLWMRLLDAWGARNTIQFAESPEEAEINKKARLVPQIQGFYNQAPNIAFGDRRHIFNTDLDVLLTKSSTYLQQWINMKKPALVTAIKQAKEQAQKQQHDIRDYFHAQPP